MSYPDPFKNLKKPSKLLTRTFCAPLKDMLDQDVGCLDKAVKSFSWSKGIVVEDVKVSTAPMSKNPPDPVLIYTVLYRKMI